MVREKVSRGFGLAALMLTVLLVAASPAQAYIGPGAGLSAIGSVLALLAAVALAVVGFVWYPVKRLRRRRAARNQQEEKATG